ncbi:hypothetical protein ESCO_005390 [Escovopsis weberi]|uniref:EXPERA domain-containing protein n=1 Tax=Escovopsis weberi TaxID=150374 RepID=A0A0M9VV55_ESCWE|nr:hypothetical protein ESCO_005390 [Escovopsis weberi]
MASTSTKPAIEWLYLVLISFQLVAIVLIDFVPFYPGFLWREPDAPLHFLLTIREAYYAYTNDPYYAHDITVSAHGPRPYFDCFLLIQSVVELPLAVYLVYHLASWRRIPAPAELAMLVFAPILAVTAAVCLYESQFFSTDDVPEEKIKMLMWGAYFPYTLLPTVMVVDMWTRLLGRLNQGKAKTQ